MGCVSSKEEIDDTSWLVQIDHDYLISSVSVYGLKDKIENFSKALSIVQGNRSFLMKLPRDLQTKVIRDSNKLYGLLHARYICTEDGAYDMFDKYNEGLFGHCPRVLCNNQNLLPIGMSYDLGVAPVKTYCPRCHDIYESDMKIDGAYFGPDFPMYFIKANHVVIDNYISNNWVESGNENLDHRLKRWPENLQT